MRKWLFSFGLVVFLAESVFAIDLMVSPSEMAWDDQGWVSASITNLVEEGVDLKLIVDLNGNGVIDGDDFVLTVFEMDDGGVNPLDAECFVDDKDGVVNGVIETTISFYGVAYNALHTVGDYIWQAIELDDNDLGVATSTVPFSITQSASSVWITGEVQNYIPPNDSIPGAHVSLEYFSEVTGASPSVWADENGAFTLYVPAGISTSDVVGVFGSAAEHLSVEEDPDTGDALSFFPFIDGLVTGENVMADPLYVVASYAGYDLYEISGAVVWVEPIGLGFETNPMAGVFVEMESDGEEDEIFSWDITDENGAFTVVFPGDSQASSSEILCEGPLLNMRGHVGTFSELAVTGTMSGVEIICPVANALARACVTDQETGEPLVGVDVFFESEDFFGDVYTLSNGFYEMGLLAGTYEAECDRDTLDYQHYISPEWKTGLVVSTMTPFTNAPFELERGYVLSGYVYDTNHTPLLEGSVALIERHDHWEQWRGDADVNRSGAYSLLSPTGTVFVRTSDFGEYFVDLYYTNSPGSIEEATSIPVTTNGVSGIDFYLPWGARVEGNLTHQNGYFVPSTRVRALVQDELGDWRCIGSGNTQEGDVFSFAALAESNVFVRTDMDYDSWSPKTWYGDTCSSDLALSVDLIAGQLVSYIEINVLPGYEVHGDVLDQASLSGLSGAVVTAFDAASNRYDHVFTDGAGNYYDLFMPTNVALVFYAGLSGYEGEFYDHVYDPADATGVILWAHERTNVAFVLYSSEMDSDGDGLADFEEDSHPDGGYNSDEDYSNPNDPDTDGDGANDGKEQFSGTDPQDGNSLFQIVESTPDSSGLILRWSSVPGREYFVQENPYLVDGVWSNVFSLTATSGVSAYTNGLIIEAAFYRVVISGL